MPHPGQTDAAQDSGHDQGGERAQHVDFAMREVDQPDDAVHHGVAERYERVNTAARQTAEENAQKILKIEFHPVRLAGS